MVLCVTQLYLSNHHSFVNDLCHFEQKRGERRNRCWSASFVSNVGVVKYSMDDLMLCEPREVNGFL